MSQRPRILGELLVEAQAATRPRIEEALTLQQSRPLRLGEILVQQRWASEQSIARALSIQLGLPLAEGPLPRCAEARAILPHGLAASARVVPLELRPRRLVLATDEPTRLDAIEDVRFQSGRRLELRVTWPQAIDEGLRALYGDRVDMLVSQVDAAIPDEVAAEGRALERAAATAPVVQLVDRLIEEAHRARASDLHLEPAGDSLRVRFRVDGVLREVHGLPARVQPLILSRLKILAGMDISVRRRPQDGGFRMELGGRALAFRVSTLPVDGREKGVVRLLDPGSAPESLAALGMRDRDRERVESILQGQQGVLLATGPTGSGKSSTLHAALRQVDATTRNVVTLEDPIEYPLIGATQVQVHPRAGLGFAEALRAVLRQDPDVVMVGEIRDGETAEIAMSAAVTGHMVLSSLHTNDAPSALSRLLQMGVPRHLVASGVAGVIAQRLVRVICPQCAGRGCERCGDGFAGRTGVFQVLVVSDRIREAIADGAPGPTLRRIAREDGMGHLLDDARRQIAEGRTSPTEVARVLRSTQSVRPCQRCSEEVPEDAIGCPWCGEPAVRRCGCGRRLESDWRFCPACIRKAV